MLIAEPNIEKLIVTRPVDSKVFMLAAAAVIDFRMVSGGGVVAGPVVTGELVIEPLEFWPFDDVPGEAAGEPHPDKMSENIVKAARMLIGQFFT